jgi:hypothetical protein
MGFLPEFPDQGATVSAASVHFKGGLDTPIQHFCKRCMKLQESA